MSLKVMTLEESMSLEDALRGSLGAAERQGRDLIHTHELWEVAVPRKPSRSFEDTQPTSEEPSFPTDRARCEARETDEGWVVEFWFAGKPYGQYQSPSTLITTRLRRWPSNSA